VKEQSHKSEMRAALQGDFERLRARRDDASPPLAVAPLVAAAVAEPEEAPPVEPMAVEPTIVEPVADPVVADTPPARSSWLDRLRDRR
jgi:hypothetical protein